MRRKIGQSSLVAQTIRKWQAEPEAYALRQLFWQLFVTLTFSPRAGLRGPYQDLVHAWLDDIVRSQAGLHFSKLLWVSRFEVGRGGQYHFHLIISGLPARATEVLSRDSFVTMWHNRTRGRAEVAVYDPTRDGVGYMLKIASPSWVTKQSSQGRRQSWGPTLSKSILRLRRFRR